MTTAHPPLDVRIFVKECSTLVDAGFDVILIAPHDRDEVVNGVRIRAIRKAGGRAARMLRSTSQVLRIALSENAALYHFHDPELIPIALALTALGRRVIYDVHEDLPRAILHKKWIRRWQRGLVSRTLEAVELFTAQVLAGIVAATPVIGARFPRRKTAVVQNFPLPHELANDTSVPYERRGRYVLYVGVVTEERGILEMVQAITLVPAELGVTLKIAGTISQALRDRIARDWPGAPIEWMGWQSRAQVAELMASARAGLVLFHPLPNHVHAQPNKLFEYMSASLPLIASDFPLWQELIGTEACGLLVDPMSPAAIADAIRHVFERPDEAAAMGARGRSAVVTKFNWASQGQQLVAMYRSLLGA